MPIGKLVFAQLMDFLPLHTFRRCVARYPSSYPTKTFSHLDQYLCMAFAQLTFRESLRDIEVCLRAHESKLYHLGIRGHVARSSLADANEKRDWRIYRDFANALIAEARRLYANGALCADLCNTAHAQDTAAIDLSLKLFPRAHYRATSCCVSTGCYLLGALRRVFCRGYPCAAGDSCSDEGKARVYPFWLLKFGRVWRRPTRAMRFARTARPFHSSLACKGVCVCA